MIARTKHDVVRAAAGGAMAGLFAGVALTVMMTVMSLAGGKDIWYGMKGASAPLLGARAMSPGFDFGPVVLGLLTHFLISMLWAAPFGILFWHLKRGLTMLAGVAWGFVVWLGMYYVVLPAVGLGSMTTEAPLARVITYHLFYSILMAIFFLGYERVEQRVFHQELRPAKLSLGEHLS